jgi:hypothetical protein
MKKTNASELRAALARLLTAGEPLSPESGTPRQWARFDEALDTARKILQLKEGK